MDSSVFQHIFKVLSRCLLIIASQENETELLRMRRDFEMMDGTGGQDLLGYPGILRSLSECYKLAPGPSVRP